MECRFFQTVESRAEVLFAGLAPGMTGVYQISVRAPQNPRPSEVDPSRATVSFSCGAEAYPDVALVEMSLAR